MLQPLSATSRAMKIGLTTDRYSLTDLSMIAYWTIRWRLMAVPGVANVAIWGDRLKQLQLQVDPEKLHAHGVTLDDAQSVAVGRARLRPAQVHRRRQEPGGRVHRDARISASASTTSCPCVGPGDRWPGSRSPTTTRPTGTRSSSATWATIAWGHQPLFGDAVINDKPGLMLVVEKFPWANTLDVTRGVEQGARRAAPGPARHPDRQPHLPAGRRSSRSRSTTSTDALLLGTLLVVFVLVAFLFQWRAALISLLAIPLSLMAAAIVLYLRGATINTMVLAGFVIAVGVVVDDAIIDIENIVRRLRQTGPPAHPTTVHRRWCWRPRSRCGGRSSTPP